MTEVAFVQKKDCARILLSLNLSYTLEGSELNRRAQTNWLCALGLHKWRNTGEPVTVTWTEPSPGMARLQQQWRTTVGKVRFDQGSREVSTERECLRCGIAMKRKLVENPDGTVSCTGWELLPDRTHILNEKRKRVVR